MEDDLKVKVNKDITDIADAGFDKYLARMYGTASNMSDPSRLMSARNLIGGKLGARATIEIGSGLIKIDGANKRIVINDGTNDRILIGYQEGGF